MSDWPEDKLAWYSRNDFTTFVEPFTPFVEPFVPPDKYDHLRNHVTDGYWHDDCSYCYRRRVHGGNGVTDPPPDKTPRRATNEELEERVSKKPANSYSISVTPEVGFDGIGSDRFAAASTRQPGH